MAWFASGLFALLLAGWLGVRLPALLLAVAALGYAPFVYPLPTLAAGIAAAALLHVLVVWVTCRVELPRLPPPLLLAAGAVLCLFGLFGPEEGLF